jgi:hypothetical protein
VAFQLWIADVLNAAGLQVVEESGWRTRSGSEDTDASSYSPIGLVAHETRGTATSTVAGEIRVLIDGRTGLSGPIAQTFLSRDGTWHVVAAGLCHHVKTGWGGAFSGYGNTRLFGVEAQHAESESWAAKPTQYSSYVRGVAAICKHQGWTSAQVVGHKEHQPGDKPDPEFDMDRFRADVRAVMEGETMSVLVRKKGELKVWLADGILRRWVESPTELAAIQAAGKAGRLSIASGGAIVDVVDLDAYGQDIAELGTAPDLDALAVKLAALLKLPTTEEIAAAIGRQDAAGLRAAANMVDAPPA